MRNQIGGWEAEEGGIFLTRTVARLSLSLCRLHHVCTLQVDFEIAV